MTLDALWVGRYGGYERLSILDGLYSLGLLYHVERFAFGGGLGFGIPARAIPAFEAKLSVAFPIIPRWSGLLGYAFWEYRNGKRIHIYNAGLTYEATDWLRIDLLWWTSYVLVPRLASYYPQVTDLVHVASLRLTYIDSPHLSLGVSYTYGPQLDQTQDPERLLSLRSHIFGAFADWLIQHDFGVRGSVDVEWRRPENTPALFIFSTEVAAYHRW